MLCNDAIDVAGYEGIYAVTTDGRVYSHSRVVDMGNGRFQLRKGRWLKPDSSSDYLRVTLSDGMEVKRLSVHRLVAAAFVLNKDNKPEVNHIDGDKRNNNASNLEWVTTSENSLHAFSLGLRTPMSGEKNPNRILSKDQVDEIREMAKDNSLSHVAKLYGISFQHVSKIKNNQRWTK